MENKNLKSQFVFTKQQRVGILLLIVLIFGLLNVYFFVDFGNETSLNIDSSEVIKVQQQIDSTRAAEIERRKPKLYPFNPNFITDYKAYTLGLTPLEYDKLKSFRERDKWINSVADFKRVTGVSDSILNVISPLFKFPDWITNPKPRKKKSYTNSYEEKPISEKIDLNIATIEQLQQVSGIGPALSERIVKYRDEKLQGFSSDIQLYSVYGLRDDVVERIHNLFTVKTPKPISKMNINSASASDIATIPGVSFNLAKEIWEFVKLRGGITQLSELEKIEQLSIRRLAVIELYLFAE